MRLLYAGPWGRIVCRGGRWEVVQVWQVGDGEEAWGLGAVEASGVVGGGLRPPCVCCVFTNRSNGV